MPTLLRRLLAVSFALLVAAGLSARRSGAQAIAEPVPGQPGKDVVWVPTPPELVEKMLDMAGVTADDVVVDLGSGDGRTIIAAAGRGARAIGVEFNPDLVQLSRRRAAEAGVAAKAAFVQGDMYKADLSEATVLALFLTPEHLDGLQQNFLAMKPGTRIVMNTFSVTDWEPDATETLAPPCKVWCTAILVVVPAKVDGMWETDGARMNLRQDYQFVRGTIGARQVTGRLHGRDIALRAGDTEFTGRVSGSVIEGTKTTAGRRTAWRATRVTGQP